jgi:hypothetical protein
MTTKRHLPTAYQLRPTPEDTRRIEELRRYLQQRNPDVRVGTSDVLRYAIQSSASNISANTPTALTDDTRKR